MNWEHDRGGRDTLFHFEGRMYRAGARSTRCFRDIQSQFSETEAVATARKAISLMPQIEKDFPRGEVPRPQLRPDEEPVIVAAFLLAGGLTPEQARKLADSVYSKADGSRRAVGTRVPASLCLEQPVISPRSLHRLREALDPDAVELSCRRVARKPR